MTTLPALIRTAAVKAKHWLGYGGEGVIPKNWSIGWWQEGRSPLTYGPNSVVEACTQAYGQTVAMCPLPHLRDRPDNGRDRLKDSAVARVMRKPNDYQTRSDFMLNLVHSLLKTGNAYAYIGDRDIGAKAPRSMHLLNPNVTRAYRISTGEVFYGISPDRWASAAEVDHIVPAREIAHFKLHTPRDPLIGESPVSAAAASLAANNAITASQAAFFENMARPSGVLTADIKMNSQQMQEVSQFFKEKSKGMMAGEVPVLGGGLRWVPLTITSQDSQLIEALKMTIQDIASVYRVPLPMLNLMEGATFNNAETLVNWWLSSGLGFLLTHIELTFEKAFDLPANEHLDFDTKVLLRPDFQTRINALGESIQKGVYSPNEARAIEGLPAVEGGEDPRVQQQVVPLKFADRLLDIEEAKAKQPKLAPAPEPTKSDDHAIDERAYHRMKLRERMNRAA